MPSKPQRFWLAAFLAAWSVDLLFWQKSVGISLLIFVAVVLVGAFALSKTEGVRPANLSYVLAGLLILMIGVTLLRSEGFSRFINAFTALAGLGLLAMTFRTGSWVRFRLFDYILTGFALVAAALGGAAGLRPTPGTKEGEGGGTGRKALRDSLPVVRGLLLALPVVLVLGGLLSSADVVFADRLENFFKLFDLGRVPEYIFRLFYVLVLAYAFAGLYRQSMHSIPWLGFTPGNPEALAEKGGITNHIKPFLGATEGFIILGAVNLLFAFFVIVQFQYFFGGETNINVAGYTYSEYARRGFGELVMVAVLSLLLYLTLNAVTRRETPLQYRAFTGLGVLLVALVLVMLVSAFQRVLLYEDAYGFTSLRTYTHIFIPWLGFLLLSTIVMQILRREEYFGALLLFTTFGFALTFGALNIDGMMVRLNVGRAVQGQELDGEYLATLSDDAIPAMVEAYNSSAGLPDEIRDQLGAALSCHAYDIAREKPQSWVSYHPGKAWARSAFSAVDVSAYPVKDNSSIGPIVDLGNETFSCLDIQYMD